MPNPLLRACGKLAYNLGTAQGEICEMLSTFAPTAKHDTTSMRGKATVLPIFINGHSTELSTAFFTPATLLHSYLSPLSTVPITTRTKERIER